MVIVLITVKRLTAFALLLAVGVILVGAAVAESPVTVRVTLDGRPTDAQLIATTQGFLRGVFYTGVEDVGVARFALPWGDYRLTVSHGGGFTTAPVEVALQVRPPQPLEVEVPLTRLFEPNARGYYSADTHAHSEFSPDATTPVDQLVAVQLAADLDLVFLSDHNSTKGHARFAAVAQARGVPALLSEEITTLDWGHFNAYPLREGALIPYRRGRTPEQYLSEARAQGALVFQVNHPFSSQPGYLDKEGRPGFTLEFDAYEVANGLWESSNNAQALEGLFALWNRGLHITAVGVSDDHDWMKLDVQYGTPRTYAYVEGALSARAWAEAIRAGHAFVSYGPLVYLSAGSGRAIPGETLAVARGAPVRFEATLHSVTPLAQAEWIRDGQVVQTQALEGTASDVHFEAAFTRSGWVALRVTAADGDFALTNPIWVDVR